MTAIANYYASVSMRPDMPSIKRVDRYLGSVEKRLAAIQSKFSGALQISQAGLNKTLGDSLDRASRRLVFQVSRFNVDTQALYAALNRASRGLPMHVGGFRGGAGGGYDTQGRIALENQRHRNRMELEQLRSSNRAVAGHAGLGAGMGVGMMRGPMGVLMGYGAAGYGVALGVRGIGAMNQANQELISTRLTTQAVIEAQGGTPATGERAFNWLRGESFRLGFSYMDQAQDYNSFLANALGAGESLSGAQGIYKGFSEYQRAMGITPARQKLVMSALSQMMGKGVVSMEELRRQMAESMPGTMSIFGNAYQAMLASQGRGGGLTGQAAVAALLEAVPTGNVRAADLLPFVSEEMRRRAAPKLEVASGTSLAWQGRLGGMRTEWATRASDAGLEEGQMRMFRWVTQWMNENQQVAEKFGAWWKDFTTNMTILLSFPALLQDFFDGGKGNPIERWLGEDVSREFREAWNELAGVVKPVSEALKELTDVGLIDILRNFTSALAHVTVALNGVAKLFRGEVTLDDVLGIFGNVKSALDHHPGSIMYNKTVGGFRDNLIGKVVESMSYEDRMRQQYGADWVNQVADQGLYTNRFGQQVSGTPHTVEVWRERRQREQEEALSTQGMGQYLSGISGRGSQTPLVLNIGDVTVDGSGGNAEDVANGFVDGIMERFEERLRLQMLPNN